MKTLKTALTAAAFGAATLIAPASAGEVRYNFTSEFSGFGEIASDYRDGDDAEFVAGDVRSGPETGKSTSIYDLFNNVFGTKTVPDVISSSGRTPGLYTPSSLRKAKGNPKRQ